jgi:hypothetical protein
MALAQHGGGHGGGHVGGAGAHVFAPPISHAPIARPRFSSAPPVGGFGPGSFRFRPRPIHPWRPVFPIFPIYGYPYFFGPPFYGYGWGYGAGWGFNGCWWLNCNLFWSWGLGYNTLPFYVYGPGYYSPAYEYPVYSHGGERSDLPQLYLKDGTVLAVTDYWLVDDQLHFTIIEGGQLVEHVIALDQLDLQKTIDVASQRGFRFVLRNEPVEQYLRDHPDLNPE